jgi:hypothetical protein
VERSPKVAVELADSAALDVALKVEHLAANNQQPHARQALPKGQRSQKADIKGNLERRSGRSTVCR